MTVLNCITEGFLIPPTHTPVMYLACAKHAEAWVGALSNKPAKVLSVVPCSEMRWLPVAMSLCVSSFIFRRRSGEFFNPKASNKPFFFLFIGSVDLSLPSLNQSEARGGDIPRSDPHLEEGSVFTVVAMGGIDLTTSPTARDSLEKVKTQSRLPV